MKRTLALLLLGAALNARCTNDTPSTENPSSEAPGGPLVGVWQAVDVTATDSTGAQRTTAAQAGLRIFTPGHYSVLSVNSAAPRPLLPDSNATDAQRAAAWGPFTANAGTYEIVSDTLIAHPSVAKNPDVMAPGFFARSVFRIEGDTLWLTAAGTSNRPTPRDAATSRWVRVE